MSLKSQPEKPRIKKTAKFIGILILVLGVAVFQDFLRARYNQYAFYASESILFNFFWLLILPVSAAFRWGFLSYKLLQKISSKIIRNLAFVFLATILHLLLFAGLIHLVSWAFYEVTFRFWGNVEYSLSEDLYKYLLIYGAISLMIFRKNSPPTQNTNPPSYPEYLSISNGRETSRISLAEVSYISADSPYVAIHTKTKKYLQTNTLRALHDKLDSNQFVRIHKSTIVHLHFVHSYRSRLNGDYDIQLTNGEELRLSRNYVDNFRRKFETLASS